MTLLTIPRPAVYVPNPSSWHRDVYKNVACEKLEDALSLYQNGRYMAAMYLAGYTIECGFQALYCFQNTLITTDKLGGLGHHVNNALFWLSPATQNAITTTFSHAWSNIREYWGQRRMFDLRYNPNNSSQVDAEIFLCSVLQIHEYLALEIDRLSTPPGTASPVPSNYINRATQVHVRTRNTLNCIALGF